MEFDDSRCCSLNLPEIDQIFFLLDTKNLKFSELKKYRWISLLKMVELLKKIRIIYIKNNSV